MMFGLSAKILGTSTAAFALSTALALGWGARVDHLRAGYRSTFEEIQTTVSRLTGKKIGFGELHVKISEIYNEGQQYRRERDNARDVMALQSTSIRNYEAETKRLKAISGEQTALAARLIADRNSWIGKARAASTRLERLSAEQELKECDDVLDALYNAGF